LENTALESSLGKGIFGSEAFFHAEHLTGTAVYPSNITPGFAGKGIDKGSSNLSFSPPFGFLAQW
jgi:hypothetical protein